jgi:hypothetical protein
MAPCLLRNVIYRDLRYGLALLLTGVRIPLPGTRGLNLGAGRLPGGIGRNGRVGRIGRVGRNGACLRGIVNLGGVNLVCGGTGDRGLGAGALRGALLLECGIKAPNLCFYFIRNRLDTHPIRGRRKSFGQCPPQRKVL